jgi:hypothetical protein
MGEPRSIRKKAHLADERVNGLSCLHSMPHTPSICVPERPALPAPAEIVTENELRIVARPGAAWSKSIAASNFSGLRPDHNYEASIWNGT